LTKGATVAQSIEQLKDDIDTIGKVAGGTKRTLLGVIVVLTALLIWQQYSFSDRFTGTDFREYETQHAKDVARIVAAEKALQAETNEKLIKAVESIRREMVNERVHRSEDRVMLESTMKSVERIEKKVFNGSG
jgi:hypothetical protein